MGRHKNMSEEPNNFALSTIKARNNMSGQDNFTLHTRPGKGISVVYRGRPLFTSHSTGQARKRHSSGVRGQSSVHFTLYRPGQASKRYSRALFNSHSTHQARKRHSSGVEGQSSVHFTLYRPGQQSTPVGYRGRPLFTSHSTAQVNKRYSSGVQEQSSVGSQWD